MLAAARALADYVPMEKIKDSEIYPDAKELRSVSATVRHPCLQLLSEQTEIVIAPFQPHQG